MAVKFYTDTHIAKAVAVQGRRRGLDIIHCVEVGMQDDEDADHLAYATAQGRTVITGDEDFAILHSTYQASGTPHAGIIYLHPQNRNDIGLIVSFIVDLNDLIEGGAGAIEADVFNNLFFL